MQQEFEYTVEEVTVLNALNNASERLTANSLVSITGIDKRRIHKIISRLQTNGKLIVASKYKNELGYKIARTSSDLHAYYKQTQRQIDSLIAKLDGMKANAHKVDDYKEQLNEHLKDY